MKTRKLLIALVLGMGTTTAWAGETEERPLYKDSLAPIESRVEDLLRRMTLHEKTLQLQNGKDCRRVCGHL